MTFDPSLIETAKRVSTATVTTVLLKKGLRNVWMRGTRPLQPGPAAHRRAGLHAALRAGARGPRDAGQLGLADIHPRGDRGDAGRLHRGRRCDGRDRCRHLRRHPLRPHGQARRGGAGDRRRGARPRRRARHRPASLVPGRRGAAVGRRASPSSAGRSRSLAAASRCFRTTWSSPTTTARSLIPAALVAEVLAEAVEQERMEAWIMDEVGRGAALPGLYPMNAETRARYESAKAAASRDGEAS